MLTLITSAVLMCGGWQHISVEQVSPRSATIACLGEPHATMHVLPTVSMRTGQVWPDTTRLRTLHDQRNRLRRAPAGDLTL